MTKEDEFEKVLNRNAKEHWKPEIFEGLMVAEMEKLEQTNKSYIRQTLIPRLKKLLEVRDIKIKAQILKEFLNEKWLVDEIGEYLKKNDELLYSGDIELVINALKQLSNGEEIGSEAKGTLGNDGETFLTKVDEITKLSVNSEPTSKPNGLKERKKRQLSKESKVKQ